MLACGELGYLIGIFLAKYLEPNTVFECILFFAIFVVLVIIVVVMQYQWMQQLKMLKLCDSVDSLYSSLKL